MKHEYYTCDRCGKKIENRKRILPFRKEKVEVFTEMKTTTQDFYDIKSTAKGELMEDINSIEIEFCGYLKEEKYELCGECRKAFEKFMKCEK